jgi:hypothetical protein
MIPRTFQSVASVAVLVVLATLTSACTKVPLLAPSGSIITLLSTTTALPVNGSTDIIAQVIEPAGTPPQRGTLVSFTTNLGRLQPSEAETDTAGRAVVKFFAGSGSGTATISAISGGVSVVAANAVKILVGTAAVGSVRVSANPTLLPAVGGASTITAQALDINGNALSSAQVNFTTTSGTLDQGLVTTDLSGLASTILRTSSNATVTAAIGAQAGSTTPPPTGGGWHDTAGLVLGPGVGYGDRQRQFRARAGDHPADDPSGRGASCVVYRRSHRGDDERQRRPRRQRELG